MGNPNKKLCGECHRRWRKLYLIRGRKLCWNCYHKKFNVMNLKTAPQISLAQALNRTYTLKAYFNKDGTLQCTKNFPQVLAFRKVKLVIVDDEKELSR